MARRNLDSAAELIVQDANNQIAAILGASANYSTGDDGDFRSPLAVSSRRFDAFEQPFCDRCRRHKPVP